MTCRRPTSIPWLVLLSFVAGCPPELPDGVAAHTCALLDDGSVWCWGDNSHGELGDGTVYDRARPVAVAGLPPASSVGAGLGFTCASTLDGLVYCWGQNDEGQLGDGSTADRATPAPVPGLSGVRATAAGRDSACAVLETGEVLCWGTMGDAARTPKAVTGLLAAAVDVTVSDYGCAILTTGEVRCWRWDGVAWDAPFTSAVSVAPTWYASPCAALTDGSVTCTDALPGPAVAVAGGRDELCALLEDGGVWCWGDALGASTDSDSPAPYSTGAAAVAVGDDFACALLSSGGVECWGENWAGQLGDGTDRKRAAPVTVMGLPLPATAVTASLGREIFDSGCGGTSRD